MDMNYLFRKIQNMAAVLDPEDTPEACSYLDDIMDEDELLENDPFTIANELLECDYPGPLPENLRNFIEELFEASYDDGNGDAMNDLGVQYYENARGFPRDFRRAVECFQMAVDYGSRKASENLGYCYYYGRGIEIDYEKAYHCFALGAFDGHLISLYKIGDMYLNGMYVEKNPGEAFRIYSRCLDAMNEDSASQVAGPVLLRLGNAYLEGLGVEADPRRALTCYQEAELYLYDMVVEGNLMYKKSLEHAIQGQALAREELDEYLPEEEWIY